MKKQRRTIFERQLNVRNLTGDLIGAITELPEQQRQEAIDYVIKQLNEQTICYTINNVTGQTGAFELGK